jgi:hypothetical protein
MAVEGGAYSCPGPCTGGKGDAHGREGGCARVMRRARTGRDGGTHEGSLHQF